MSTDDVTLPTEDPADVPPQGGDDDGSDPEGTDALGDAGKKALDAMKERWKAERDRRKAIEAEAADLKAQISAASRKDTVDDQAKPDLETIRAEAIKAATAQANERIIRAEIRAAAAGKLADPADALRYLELTQFEVGDDGNVDASEVAEAIADLLKSKPYLAAQGGNRFQGTGDGGARTGGSRPSQLTESDLRTMTPEQIVQAQEKGLLRSLLGG